MTNLHYSDLSQNKKKVKKIKLLVIEIRLAYQSIWIQTVQFRTVSRERERESEIKYTRLDK